MSNNRQHILASLVVATLVLALTTVALTTDDAQAKWRKKNTTPNGDPGRDANGEPGENGGTGTDGTNGGDITCDRTGCH